MGLARKTVFLVMGVFIALLAAIALIFSDLIIRDALHIEQMGAQQDATRLSEAVNAVAKQLNATTRDWAHWDDTYDYVKTRDKKHRESWFIFEPLSALALKYVYIFDTTGKLVLGVTADYEEEKVVDADPEFAGQVFQSGVRLDGLTQLDGYTGIITVGEQRLLIGVAPILNTTKTLPPRGYLFLVKPVDAEFWELISERTRLHLNVSAEKTGLPGELQNLIYPKPARIKILDDSSLLASAAFSDPQGNPNVQVDITIPRTVYGQLTKTRTLILSTILAGGIFALLCTYLLLKYVLLNRIERVGLEASKIEASKDFAARVTDGRTNSKDEISRLVNTINGMLYSLEQNHAELKVARQAAERANEVKKYFITLFSHDLRNRVLAIKHFVEAGLGEKASDEVHGIFQNCEKEVAYIQGRVTEVMDVHKLEAGKETFKKVPFDFRDVVIAVRSQVLVKTAESSVQLVLDIHPSIPSKLIGDPEKLGRIIENLLNNSAKFTHEGYIGLTAKAVPTPGSIGNSSATITIEAWDTGIGIAKEKLSTVFEAFQQAHSTEEGAPAGHGIGLFSVKKMIEGMGGSVTVESEINRGTKFIIQLVLSVHEWGESEALEDWPKHAFLVSEKSLAAAALVRNLSGLGAPINLFSPKSTGEVILSGEAAHGDLLIVSEAILGDPRFCELARTYQGTVVALVNPLNISLQKRLRELKITNIISAPPLAEEILTAWRNNFQEPTTKSQPELPKPVRNITVLLVDDKSSNLLSTKALLKQANYDVLMVNNGADTVQIAERTLSGAKGAQAVDIILTDIKMPGMDGTVAAQKIREFEKSLGGDRRIPIIAVTGFSGDEERARILGYGVDEIISKPPTTEELASVLERFLRK